MVNRNYSSAAAATTLTGSITSGQALLTVAAVSGFPVLYPYTLILDPDTASEEVVTVTAGAGNALTVTRGEDGTTALTHTTGAAVVHGVSARDFTEPQEHIAATSGVHGVTDFTALSTPSKTETLTNKTISAVSNTLSDLPEVHDFSTTGTLATGAGTSRLYLDGTFTLVSVRASVGTAPVGAAVLVDVNKNGTTVYTDQAQRPSIAAAANTAVGGTAAVTAFTTGDYLTVDVDQVGSTTAGSNLTVTVRLRRS